jgi:O-antigen/teichoic acid export membrane protein
MAAMGNLSTTEEYKGYARDIGLVAGAQIAVSVLQFARLPILTKWLGASLYGDWSLIWVTVVLVTPLAVLSLGITVIRFLAAEKDTDKIREGYLSAVFTVLAAGVFFSLVLFLCSGPLATSIIGDPDSAYLVRLGSFMILTQALSQMSIAFFRTFRQMKWYSALLVAKAAIQLGLMVCFLLPGWEVSGVIVAVLASDILCITIAFWVSLRQIGFRFPKFTEIKGYLKYGLPLVPNASLMWIILSSDRYMIGYFLGAKDVGIYAAACAVASIMSLFLGSLEVVLFPTIAKSYDNGEIVKTKTYLKYSLKYLLMLNIPATFGLSVLASPLLRLFTTSEFSSGNVVIPFIASGLVVFSLFQICIFITHLVKKTYWNMRLLVIAAALNIGLNLLLIPHLGILGAAVATLIAYGVLGILTVAVSLKYLRFDLGLPFILKSVLASAIMAFAIWLLKPMSITMVIISIPLGAIIYSAIILLLRGFNKNELELLKQLLRELSKKKG